MTFSFNEDPKQALGASEGKEMSQATPKLKASVDIDSKLIAEANRGFNLCPAECKNNDLKKAFLLNAAEKLQDEQKFFGRYMAKAQHVYDILEDRKSVIEKCSAEGIDLMTLATHVVFMGKAAMRKVIKFGVAEGSPLYNQISLYKEPFLPDNPQDFVDKAWLPSKCESKMAKTMS